MLLKTLEVLAIVVITMIFGVIGHAFWVNRNRFINFKRKIVYKTFKEQLLEPVNISINSLV